MRGVRYLLGVVGPLLMLVLPRVSAATSPLLITAIQTGNSASANAEYVKLTNTSTAALDISGWRLQYKSADGADWITRATLQGSLQLKATVLLATKEYVTADVYQPMNSGLAAAGGHLRVIGNAGTQVDLIGWGTAKAPMGSAAPAPASGKALERKQDAQGNYVNTSNNAADFQTSQLASKPQVASSQTPVKVTITELLPNPATPQTDTDDEFVELYNATNETATLRGYKLLSGSNLKTSYTFESVTVAPKSYFVITSGSGNLSLTNTGGKVRLLAPDGSVMSQTDSYDTAKDNYSWSLINGKWQWSTKPSPGSVNVTAAPPVKKSTAKSKAKASSKKSDKKATFDESTEPEAALLPDEQPSTVHPMVLAAVGLGALGYGAYEYRSDIKNRLHQFRANRRARASASQKA